MPVPYDRVTTQDPTLNLIQSRVAQAFDQVPDQVTDADGITTVDTSTGTKSFLVPDSCKWLVCLTSGNALTVSLPSPRAKKTVVVVCSGKNPVTVQRQDGKPGLFGGSIELTTNQSRLFVANGQDWS